MGDEPSVPDNGYWTSQALDVYQRELFRKVVVRAADLFALIQYKRVTQEYVIIGDHELNDMEDLFMDAALVAGLPNVAATVRAHANHVRGLRVRRMRALAEELKRQRESG